MFSVFSNSYGCIAQWLERLTADQQVPGSNPGAPFLERITPMRGLQNILRTGGTQSVLVLVVGRSNNTKIFYFLKLLKYY